VTSVSDKHFISKISSMEIENFCGLIGNHQFNTDADLVLIAGPNGYGKTSFLNALLLVLSGYQYEPEGFISQKKEEFKIHADLKINRQPKQFFLSYNKKNSKKDIYTLWRQALQDKISINEEYEPELKARLCGFFQEHVEKLFDETTRGETIRDFFDPLPMYLKDIRDYLDHHNLPKYLADKKESLKKKWDKEDLSLKNIRENLSDEELDGQFKEEWENFILLYKAIIKDSATRWPEPEIEPEDTKIEGFVSEVASRTGMPGTGDGRLFHLLRNALDKELNLRIQKARKQAAGKSSHTQEILQELSGITNGIEQLEKKFPNLDSELHFFSSRNKDLPDLELIFRSLAENVSSWSKAPVGPDRLSRVVEEINSVVAEEAQKCSLLLEGWLRPRREAQKRLRLLERRKRELERKLKESRTSQQIDRLQDLKQKLKDQLNKLDKLLEKKAERKLLDDKKARRQEIEAQLDRAISTVTELSRILREATSPSKYLLEQLSLAINTVLGRFSLVEGIKDVKLNAKDSFSDGEKVRQIYKLQTADGRELHHLSTGQKAQMAVAVLVGQNLLISKYLHHRVIILDDVTTAYDLSNLTREAILWRQLAYGKTGDSTRQIFISSHHEDLTNQLLDLLIPPSGHSMRLIRFTGWDNKNGPAFEQYDVEPTGSINSGKDSGGSITNNLIQNMGAGPWRLI